MSAQIRVVEDESEKGERNSEEDQEFLKRIEQTMLSQVVLQGVAGVRKVFLRDAKSTFPDSSPHGDGYRDQNEWVLDTEGTNLLEASHLPTPAREPLGSLVGRDRIKAEGYPGVCRVPIREVQTRPQKCFCAWCERTGLCELCRSWGDLPSSVIG